MTKQTLDGTELEGMMTVVAGGTGNVGFFLVDAFLRAGAHVVVPTRSQSKYDRLLSRLPAAARAQVEAVLTDIGTPEGAAELARNLTARNEALAAVAAAPASWHQVQSMYQAGFADFRNVVESRLYPHFLTAEALLPLLRSDGAYVTINGPVGFTDAVPPGSGSIATVCVAQNKMILGFAGETGGRPRVNDIVMWAYLGPQGTRRGSDLAGEHVGDFVVGLVSGMGASIHGKTIHLRSLAQVTAALSGKFEPEDSLEKPRQGG